MAKDLFEMAAEFYPKAEKSSEGQKVLKHLDQVYQFRVGGKDEFYVEVKGGHLGVKKGKTAITGMDDMTLIEADGEELKKIFLGKVRPIEVQIGQKWRFGGGDTPERTLITMITRIAQEVVREEIIENYQG